MDLKAGIREVDPPFPITITDAYPERVIGYMKKKEYFWEEDRVLAEREGHRYFGLYLGEEIKGFFKVAFGKVFISDFKEIFELPPGTAYLQEGEVNEDLRGKKVFKYFIGYLLRILKGSGWHYAICHIPSWNLPSAKAMEYHGFKKVEKIRFISFLGIRWKSKDLNKVLNDAIRNI
jgi:hypothetical protein